MNVILREEKIMLVMLKMEIVTVRRIYVDKNVTNVAKATMDFQTARVSF